MTDDFTQGHGDATAADAPTSTGPIDVDQTQVIPPAPTSETNWYTTGASGAPARADAAWGTPAPPVAPSSAPVPAAGSAAGTGAPGSSGVGGSPGAAGAGRSPGAPGAPGALGAPGAGGVPAGAGAGAGSSLGPPPAAATSTAGSGGPDQPRSRNRSALVGGALLLALVSGVAGSVGTLTLRDRMTATSTGIPTPSAGSTERPEGTVANIAANALPSVVTIQVRGNNGDGLGSGFVIDRQGHILTNNHVVQSAADGGELTVLLANGKREKATITGRDVSYDLAVIRIERTDVPLLEFADSNDVVVGDPVIAVGAPLGLESTVTTGIVSALDRPVTPSTDNEETFMNAIQTDAAINPGNSGGPLLDMKGKVIGVNSAIMRVPGTGSSGSIGLGFAIPSDVARRAAEELIATGKARHPVIGVRIDRTYDGEGVKVSENSDAVVEGGAAALAGVKPGDVILEFNGKFMRSPDALIVSVRAQPVGAQVPVKIRRNGVDMDVKMTLQADKNQN